VARRRGKMTLAVAAAYRVTALNGVSMKLRRPVSRIQCRRRAVSDISIRTYRMAAYSAFL